MLFVRRTDDARPAGEFLYRDLPGLFKIAVINGDSKGFELSKIPIHIHLWHGDQDIATPISMAEYVAEQLPSSTLHTYPDRDHNLLGECYEEILSTLANH